MQVLEDALWYRDQYEDQTSKTAPRPKDIDLKTNNPYRLNGLKYPVPERLQKDKKHNPKEYGTGSICKDGKESYKIKYSGKYICSCRTYEQAYYVCQEMRKHNWDKKYLQEILDKYPEYYTWLLFFYQYIGYNKTRKFYYLTIPKGACDDGKIKRIIYHNIRDALFERDFLRDHDWDYDALVETIDDNLNPYIDMDLPPYPERRIRNVQTTTQTDKKFRELVRLLQKDIEMTQGKAAEILKVVPSTIRIWLNKYDTDWIELKTIITNNSDPFTVLKREKIYTPNLELSKPKDFNNYIYESNDGRKMKYRITKNRVTYGGYATRELALKIVHELEKVNWDKKQLPIIQEKYGCRRPPRNYIYKARKKYIIRKKLNGKTIDFGLYDTIEHASIVRDLLIANNWDKTLLPSIQDEAVNKMEAW